MEDIEKSLYQSYLYYQKGGELHIYEADSQESKNLLELFTKLTQQAGLTDKVRSNPNENLVCYWPTFLIWGQTNRVSKVVQPGMVIRRLEGTFGTGYLAITNKKVYLASFPELTKKYPFLRKRGLLVGFLAGLGGQEDERKPSTASKSWVVPASELIDEKIYESESESGLEFIRLNTNLGEWLIYPVFSNTLLDMQTGIRMVRREQFQVTTTHNEERKKDLPEAKKLIEQLDNLKAAGVLTEAEYIQKILEIKAKYSS